MDVEDVASLASLEGIVVILAVDAIKKSSANHFKVDWRGGLGAGITWAEIGSLEKACCHLRLLRNRYFPGPGVIASASTSLDHHLLHRGDTISPLCMRKR
jgi:hypothetical protein